MGTSSSGATGHSAHRTAPQGHTARAATTTKNISYRMPPVGIQADRQMDLLAAAVTTCATGRTRAGRGSPEPVRGTGTS